MDNADPKTIAPLKGLYLGREFNAETILNTLKKAGELEWEHVDDIEVETAR